MEKRVVRLWVDTERWRYHCPSDHTSWVPNETSFYCQQCGSAFPAEPTVLRPAHHSDAGPLRTLPEQIGGHESGPSGRGRDALEDANATRAAQYATQAHRRTGGIALDATAVYTAYQMGGGRIGPRTIETVSKVTMAAGAAIVFAAGAAAVLPVAIGGVATVVIVAGAAAAGAYMGGEIGAEIGKKFSARDRSKP